MSSFETVKALLEEQGKVWEAYKATNDEKLKQLETKGAADAVTVEKLGKLNERLDQLQDNFKSLEKLATLPGRGADPANEARDALLVQTANRQMEEIAQQKGQPLRKQFGNVEEVQAYTKDFNRYMRQGERGGDLNSWTRQDFQIAVDSDGGFLVPPDMSGRMVKRLYERSDIRSIANIQTTNRSELVGIADTVDLGFWWAGEAEPDQNSSTTAFNEYTIPVEEIRIQPMATLRLLEDASIDLEAWLADKAADRFSRAENTGFVAGDGIKKPRGFLSYPSTTGSDASGRAWGTLQYRGTGASGGLGTNPFDTLFLMAADIKPAYRQNGRWVAARATYAQYRQVKDSYGRYLWEPNVQVGQAPTLLGYPITEAEDMPAIAANSFSLAFGDFKEGYTIVDRQAITLLRDPFSSKGYVKFFMRKRVGGRVVNFDAIKLLQMA